MFIVALISIGTLLAGYYIYGRYVSRVFSLDDSNITPAVRKNDGNDFVPTKPAILLGQHFAAIAAVGPIAGPILAGGHYGWVPGLIWILLGTIFIGAVHDFSCLVASVRHDARSIGDVLSIYLGKSTALLFSLFIWLCLIYIIVVFMDLTASAFVNKPEFGDMNFGPGVATSSLLYLGISILMGIALYKFKWNLTWTTVAFVPIIFFVIFIGQKIPIVFGGDVLQQQKIWNLIILGYCCLAALIPLWLLLQPRGYLGGFILYATFIVGVIGLFFGEAKTAFPMFSPKSESISIFPLLFTTIACGAISGFHGLVSSGTTSKQIAKESHTRPIGFGGMLCEGFVAVIAMSTLMMSAPGSEILSHGPDEIYARGLATFMLVLGIPMAAGITFGKLAFATFIYDTLDVTTRLGRYIFQEITGITGKKGAIIGTAATLVVPALTVFMSMTGEDGSPVPLWRVFWPAFGASNQLLAALSLAGITIWLKKSNRNWWITGIPAIFMSIVTISSLLIILRQSFEKGKFFDPVGTPAILMLILAAIVLSRSVIVFFKKSSPA